jgi:microsomal prostaglandin-E synthase 2
MASHVKLLLRPSFCVVRATPASVGGNSTHQHGPLRLTALAFNSNHRLLHSLRLYAHPTAANGFATSARHAGPGADHKYKSKEEKEADEGKKKSGKKQLLFKALGVGAVVGGVLGYQSSQSSKKKAQIANDGNVKEYILTEKPPDFPVARSISTDTDRSGLKVTLFQYQTCPFCCKARAFLDYYGINYDVIEVNSVLRTQMKWSKYKKVPVVVVEYKDKILQLNDSSVIVSALFSKLADPTANLEQIMDCYPTIRYVDADGKEKADIQNQYFLMYNEAKVNRTKEDIVEERRWRRWADDTLVHTLSPNVYQTPSEALATFQWFDQAGNWPNLFSTWERYLVIYAGAMVMWLIGKRLKKRHAIKDDPRESLYDACNHWTKGLKKKGTPFMGGEKPNLADLAVYGVLSAIEGCTAFADARRNTSIGAWFDLMKESVGKRRGQLDLEL